MHKVMTCACGDGHFSARLQRTEQVGLLTCQREGHTSRLLDSRDLWLDYEPTDALLDTPLDACPEPWLKAKQTELTAFWLPSDVDDVVRHLAELGARCYFAGWHERPQCRPVHEVCTALASTTNFDLFFALREIEFPDPIRDCWKRLPLIHIPSPTHIKYRQSEGKLHYLHWADEIFVEGRAVPQDAAFLKRTTALCSWLRTRFVSERGKRTFDNPQEFARIKAGW